MSSERKNRKTVLFGVLIVVLLVGVCFVCVTFYARHEINKPKFQMPKLPEQPLLTEQLTDKDAAAAYALQQYADTIGADNTQGSWRTELRLGGDWETPLSGADEAILLFIRDNAGDTLASFYPSEDAVRLTETSDVPQLNIQPSDVLDYDFTLGRYNGEGELVDTDRYFLSLTVDPAAAQTQTLTDSETFRSIENELSPVASLSDTQIEAQSFSVCFVIDRVSEELVSVEIVRDLRVTTAFHLNDRSAALSDVPDGTVVLPYGTTQKIEFKHYGAHFTERAIAVQPGDIKALPASVRVADEATKADYSLRFVSSDPQALSFDEDGVMTVGKETSDDPITVTMTLEYEGHTYTDDLIVYITQWEVETNVGA